MADLIRCSWCTDSPLNQEYHDLEWGVPTTDSAKLFEMLCLEGAQAGLSWITILRKREHYRKVFDQFDPDLIARYGDDKVSALLSDPGIVRNRLKVHAFISNACAFIQMRDAGLSLGSYLWNYVDGEPIQNAWTALNEVPGSTPLSDRISKDLKKRGFSFVGSTICYAFMQASGMVNDHLVHCFRHEQILRLKPDFSS